MHLMDVVYDNITLTWYTLSQSMFVFACSSHSLLHAGGKYVVFCAVVQNVKLVVIGVGYTITAAISMV